MKSLLIFIFLLFIKNSFSQITEIECNKLKNDTISGVFLLELNTKYEYYISGDALVQDNLMFKITPRKKINPNKLYIGDTVFLKFFDNTYELNQFKKCTDLKNIDKFSNYSENIFRKNKIKRQKNILKFGNNLKYLKIKAKIVVHLVGSHQLIIPSVFGNCQNNSLIKYCNKIFPTTYLILKIIYFE